MALEMAPYEYSRLPNKQSIRLLELFPGFMDMPLKCRLRVVDVEKPLAYSAVSYVWGDATQTMPLHCNGKSLKITRNLADLLQQLRSKHKRMLLWADAVCIDQSNSEEKSVQVAMMGLIYQKCVEVFIWLGQDDESEDKAAFHGIKDFFLQLATADMPENYTGFSSAQLAAFDYLEPGEKSMTKVMLKLFERPWFSRVWVVQEVGMGSRATVMCGKAVVDWIHVGLFAIAFKHKEKLLLEHLEYTDIVNRVFHLCTTFVKQPFKWEQSTHRFLYVLDNGRAFQATDPRDKIYAFLAHETAKTEDGKPFIEPDYSKSVLEVYRDLALGLIDKDSSLEVLSAVQHDPISVVIADDFPSWVPRWDRHYGCRMLGRYQDKHFAGGNSEAVVIPSEDPNILKVEGILFDIVCSHTRTLVSKDFNLPPMATTPGPNVLMSLWVESKIDTSKHQYPRLDWPSFPNLKEAFSKTFSAGETAPASGYDMLDPLADFSAYWLRVVEPESDEDLTDFDREYFSTLRVQAASGNWERYREAAAGVSHMRKFFFCENQFMGLGPAAMQIDDRVCVLFGADTPFVLRPKGDKWLVVGECYVHGLMQGQARRAWRRGVFKTQVFELC